MSIVCFVWDDMKVVIFSISLIECLSDDVCYMCVMIVVVYWVVVDVIFRNEILVDRVVFSVIVIIVCGVVEGIWFFVDVFI